MSLSGEGDEARVGHCRDRDELRGGDGPKATRAMALGVAQETSYTHVVFP
jgi:hypothetical protein